MSTHRITVLTALVALATGCAGGTGQPEGVSPEERTTLRVENQAFDDMRIYVLRGSQRIRIGTVNGGQTQVIKLSRSIVLGATTLQFQVHPIAGQRSPFTEQITVHPGDELVLRIPPR